MTAPTADALPGESQETPARELWGLAAVVELKEVELKGVGAARALAEGVADARTAVLVSPDVRLRQRIAANLVGMRWRVREASGGAEAMMYLEARASEAILIDSWLPDLEAGEFAAHVRLLYPAMDLLRLGGGRVALDATTRSPRRNELLQAMREARESDGPRGVVEIAGSASMRPDAYRAAAVGSAMDGSMQARAKNRGSKDFLPDLVGCSQAMRELGRLVRLVAPRSTTVLIEGETGTGKELVAKALHGLSRRAGKPFAVLNCAAIPESLLEAELFGHTRGAFTGAVQSRIGRIEMANGGTLLLDEIGEMPVGMQAKMLRFLESGELQRVGENQTMRVDVRLIAATHQPLEQRSAEGTFRLDLYHRLAVFPIEVAPLRERMEDIAVLAEHFLERMGRDSPRKRLAPGALDRLQAHCWPGNVRELMHVLERGVILSGESPEVGAADIRYRVTPRD